MIIVAVGSNLPFCGLDSQQIVLAALFSLGRVVTVEKISPFYETPAWPNPDDPSFVNAVATVGEELRPEALLAALHAIEEGFGRKRAEKNAPRTLDLDLVAYREIELGGDGQRGLQLPHPRLQEREFVLAPLCDIAPEWRHPGLKLSAEALLAGLPTRNAVRLSQK